MHEHVVEILTELCELQSLPFALNKLCLYSPFFVKFLTLSFVHACHSFLLWPFCLGVMTDGEGLKNLL